MKNQEKSSALKRNSGMLWLHFIIWIQLIIAIVYFLWAGIVFLRGTIYGGENGVLISASMYEIYPLLSILDKLQGIVFILLAIMGFIVRKDLVNRKRNAPRRYLNYLVIICLEPMIHNGLVSIIYSMRTTSLSISTIVMTLFIYFGSYRYFKKRMAYFVK